MKKFIMNAAAVGFLVLFLPYTMTLLIEGRQGIHREKELPALEYQVLSHLMGGDYSWMDERTLDLMAILYRTECVRADSGAEAALPPDIYRDDYSRMYDAVMRTEGQVVTVDGEYRDLPYHAVSGGRTREGGLLGEEYTYVRAVDCPDDRAAEDALRVYRFSERELGELLEPGRSSGISEDIRTERDASDYVSRVVIGDREWQGEAFRSLLNLPSSCFWLDTNAEKGEVCVTVKGSGHGFGISLYTADCMIRAGARLEDVVQKFYQDAECITIP